MGATRNGMMHHIIDQKPQKAGCYCDPYTALDSKPLQENVKQRSRLNFSRFIETDQSSKLFSQLTPSTGIEIVLLEISHESHWHEIDSTELDIPFSTYSLGPSRYFVDRGTARRARRITRWKQPSYSFRSAMSGCWVCIPNYRRPWAMHSSRIPTLIAISGSSGSR